MLHPTSHFPYHIHFRYDVRIVNSTILTVSSQKGGHKVTYFYLCSMGQKGTIFSKLIPEEEKKVYRVLFSNFNNQALYVQKGGFIYLYVLFNYQFFVFHFIFGLFKATLHERLTLVPRKLNTAGSFCWPGKGLGGVGGPAEDIAYERYALNPKKARLDFSLPARVAIHGGKDAETSAFIRRKPFFTSIRPRDCHELAAEALRSTRGAL